MKFLMHWRTRSTIVVLLLVAMIWLLALGSWWWILTAMLSAVVLAWLFVDLAEGWLVLQPDGKRP